jgi:hypothetical protein
MFSILFLYSNCGYAKEYVYAPDNTSPGGPVKISGKKRLDYNVNDSVKFAAFVDLVPITMTHQGLQKISPLDEIAIIKGTMCDNDPLDYLNIYYKTDKDIMFSTKTVIVPYQTDYCIFNATITINVTGATYFYYRLEGVCLANEHGYWPDASGNYYTQKLGKFEAVTYTKAPNSLLIQNLFHRVEISAANSAVVNNSGGTVMLVSGNPSEEATSIEIPAGALPANTTITITELLPSTLPNGNAPSVSEKPVAAFRFEPEGLVFLKPVTVKLHYKDSNQDGIVDGTNYPEKDLKIMWWDGVAWRFVGGDDDPLRNIVVYDRLKHFSVYALFPASALSNDDYRPKERIITPATADGINDYASFPSLGIDDTVNIYDVTGRRVRQLTGNANLSWDGKDDSGKIVDSGLYVYQIKKADKTIISGTIVVAK